MTHIPGVPGEKYIRKDENPMKKILALLLAAALLGGAALAETDEQTRTRDITIEGVTETINETLYTSSSGYSIWLQDGWAWQVATDETAADETVVAEDAAEDAADETTWLEAEESGESAENSTWLGDESLNYAPDVYVPDGSADTSLTVQPAFGLTADDADSMLGEASYTEDAEAVVGEIEAFAMESGVEAKTVEVVSGGVCYRYYFIPGDSFSLCVTAQCPEEAIEGNGARMAEMVASIAFVA